MKSNNTHIIVILDRSGSMGAIQNDMIGGFNRFVEDQRSQPGECTLSLVQFDSDGYDVLCEGKPINDVALLDRSNYVPRGSTPLHDAICRTVDYEGVLLSKLDEKNRPEKVVCLIVTDGLENSSTRFHAKDVRARIERQQKDYNWKFVFLGSNQDAVLTGETLGVKVNSALTFVNTARGISQGMGILSAKLTGYRSDMSSHADIRFNDEERRRAMEDDEEVEP